MEPERRSWTAWIIVLYLASGLPFGIVQKLVPVWLLTQGTSRENIGLIKLVNLPWVLKFLWAPLVDRLGRSAAWIVVSLMCIAGLTTLLPLLPLGLPVAVVLFSIALASATQDVAIDGFTAAALPLELQGRANGLRVAAYRGAMLVAGGGVVALSAWLPWPLLFGALGGVAVALAGIAYFLPSATRPALPAQLWGRALWEWMSQPGGLALIGFALLYKLGDATMTPMIEPFWLDSHLTVADIGLVSTTVGTALTVGGALLGGEIVTRIGLYRGLWLLGGAQAIAHVGYLCAALAPTRWTIYTASGVESLCMGLGTAPFLALFMRACKGEQTATRFALLTALYGLTGLLAGLPSGFGVTAWGYPAFFGLCFALALPAFAVLPRIRVLMGDR